MYARQDRQTLESCFVNRMERETRCLFSVHLFIAFVQVRTHNIYMFAVVVDSLFCICWGSATSGSASDYLYTSHFGAPPRFKSRPIFDYYRLCAINRRFLDVRSRPSVGLNLASLSFCFPYAFSCWNLIASW